MNSNDKKIVLYIQNIIDIIIDEKEYAIDSKRINELYEYFDKVKIFDNEFINTYIDFIEVFNNFFEFLIINIEKYEKEIIINREDIDHEYFIFNFNEFKTKKNLLIYQDMIEYLKILFKDNILLQGLIFYMHINALLERYKFDNNKIKVSKGIPTIEIDYIARINYYKDLYMLKVKKLLEEGKRDSVFVDKEEWYPIIEKKILDVNK